VSSGLITFVLGSREYATPLASVREVVRLEGLADLPGMQPPLAGVLDLRGAALPVLDLRVGANAETRGDVLVLENDDSAVGVAVDKVRAVVADEELGSGGGTGDELPSYVVEVRRGASGPVFLVDLAQMVAAARAAAVR
jgi:purine-binding chemotaxis protein CheW